jgi:hypothetical protein
MHNSVKDHRQGPCVQAEVGDCNSIDASCRSGEHQQAADARQQELTVVQPPGCSSLLFF